MIYWLYITIHIINTKITSALSSLWTIMKKKRLNSRSIMYIYIKVTIVNTVKKHARMCTYIQRERNSILPITIILHNTYSPSLSCEMTRPSMKRDLLIKPPSLSLSPVAPDWDAFSEPAKSTRLRWDTVTAPCSSSLLRSCDSKI